MKLHFVLKNDLSRLHDELLYAIPTLREVMTVQGVGHDVWLTLPDGADEQAIKAVVAAHVPKPRIVEKPIDSKKLKQVLKKKGIIADKSEIE